MAWWVRWGRLAAVVTLMVLLYFAVPVSGPLHLGAVVRGLLTVAGLAVLAVALVVQLRRHVHELDRRVDGLVVGIVAVVLVFALSFYQLARVGVGQVEGLRTRVDALYFTTTTLTTVGYGDIHAVGQAARALVLVQMAFDVVFVAAAAGLLTSRVRSAAESRRAASGRGGITRAG